MQKAMTSTLQLLPVIAGGLLLCGLCLLGACGSDENPPQGPVPVDLEAPAYFGAPLLDEENPTTREGIALGRMLFYDPRLSAANDVSCANCHKQENAFADVRRFSRGHQEQEGDFNSMSLANLAWTSHFFWDGRAASLEEQAVEPIVDPAELAADAPALIAELSAVAEYPPLFADAFGDEAISLERIGQALAQFERSLISADAPYDRYLRGEYSPTQAELRGMELFFTHPVPETGLRGANCGDCHSNFLTSGFSEGFTGFRNNGLDGDDTLKPGLEAVTGFPADRGKFKVPTLRNIAHTAPYMHDGRFATLEEVIAHYDHGVQLSATLDPLILEASNREGQSTDSVRLYLTEQEKADLLAFLHMLSDETFLSNPDFSNPFNP